MQPRTNTFTAGEMERTHQGRAHPRGALGWGCLRKKQGGSERWQTVAWEGAQGHNVGARNRKRSRERRGLSADLQAEDPRCLKCRDTVTEDQDSPDLPETGAGTK